MASIIRLERVRRDWSALELGRRAGLQESTISLIERGRLQALPHHRASIAAALGLAEELLFDERGFAREAPPLLGGEKTG